MGLQEAAGALKRRRQQVKELTDEEKLGETLAKKFMKSVASLSQGGGGDVEARAKCLLETLEKEVATVPVLQRILRTAS